MELATGQERAPFNGENDCLPCRRFSPRCSARSEVIMCSRIPLVRIRLSTTRACHRAACLSEVHGADGRYESSMVSEVYRSLCTSQLQLQNASPWPSYSRTPSSRDPPRGRKSPHVALARPPFEPSGTIIRYFVVVTRATTAQLPDCPISHPW